MIKAKYCASVLPLGLLAVVFSSVASAQATRTWVSGVGDDANPCSRTAPCKTWAGAISKTAPGGEIDALDPGGFGALTITKSITLDGGGGQVASVLVTGTGGIVVAAGVSDVVTIRNLAFDGLLGNGASAGNAGTTAIRFITGKTLHVENVTIVGFNSGGITMDFSGAAVSSTSLMTVQNTTVQMDSSPNAGISILNNPGSTAPLIAEINNVRVLGAGTGVLASSTSIVNVENSVIAMNSNGIQTGTGGAQVNVFNTQLNSNATAVLGSPGCVIRAFGNNVFQNGVGFNTNGGVISSDGLNNPGGNGANGIPNGTLTKM